MPNKTNSVFRLNKPIDIGEDLAAAIGVALAALEGDTGDEDDDDDTDSDDDGQDSLQPGGRARAGRVHSGEVREAETGKNWPKLFEIRLVKKVL